MDEPNRRRLRDRMLKLAPLAVAAAKAVADLISVIGQHLH